MKHFIFNGRFGDIIHSLPAVYEYYRRTGERVRFTAAAEFATVLDGCSYIDPIAAPVPWVNIVDIEQYARHLCPGDDFTVMACYGKDYSCGYRNHSYLRDSWRLSGCPTPPETQPLVFDRRSPEREREMLEMAGIEPGSRYILVACEGKSSPFMHRNALLQDVRQARPDCRVIDISGVRAHRVYDILALFEHAEALVTIDTMHLHLAAAVPSLPVYALICDGPTRWNRTNWRPQQVWRCVYGEYERFRDGLKSALCRHDSTSMPTVHHVWSRPESVSLETQRRMNLALDSWQREADWAKNWRIVPVLDSELPRRHEDGGLPYVKDLLDRVARNAADEDILSISNADVGCIHGITGYAMDAVRSKGAAFAHRFDSYQQITECLSSEAQLAALRWYPGSDWFWMTKRWWVDHRDEFPDMVLGREFWDCVLRQLIKKHGGDEVHRAVWHEKHPSLWDRPENRQNLPGNQHNRALATRWFAENHSDDRDPYRNTWNVQPGVTNSIDPMANQSLRQTVVPQHHPNIVRPIRLEFSPYRPRRVMP